MTHSFRIRKISLAVTLVFSLLSFTSFSQTNKFGISLNSLTTNFNYGNSNSELQPYKKNYKGLQAGLSYQSGITPMFSVVPELYFAVKGGSLKDNNPLTVNKSTLRLSSLEMPVLARLHCNNLYLNAGPYAAYTVGGRMKIEGKGTIQETSTKVTFGNTSNFKRWDLGFQAGAGYNFNMKKSVLTLDVRYGNGLVSISKDVQRYNRMLNISLVLSRLSRKQSFDKKG
ncbi:MAG TPA: porin family protein [Hanamia sp.]|nr:porin family protein [Hanamia sp.]